jgi:Zn-dependent peptidase ImmA (M78 family)/transcriptional regulator with XRE-family HTH domain
MKVNIEVNPELLVWARTESGFDIDYIAKKTGVKESQLTKWESDGHDVPFDFLELLAKIYKRQVAVFFLPTAPPKNKKVKDCRNLKTGAGDFSPDTLLAIRRTSRYLQFAREFLGSQYWNEQYKWIKYFNNNMDLVEKTRILREILAAPLGEQISHKRPDDAFRYWRNKVEDKLGIFVFQFSMPEDELDGFSYAFKDLPYAITINNNKHAPVRKIFTLFHELGHILEHDPGVCKTSFYSDLESDLSIEFRHNDFAGKFLVPDRYVKEADSVAKIFSYARLFNVSGETYLRRLLEERIIDRDIFFDILVDVRKKSKSLIKRKKKDGYPSMLIRSKSTRGNKLFSLVTSAASNNKISFSAASDLLGLKIR